MKNLIKNFQNFSHANELWKKGDKIVLGISGGPDSVCLFHIFLQLKKKYDLELIVAHVNYGLRGKDSEADEKFVSNLATRHNLKITVIKPRFRRKPTENDMRDIRYDFFEKIRKENKFDLISVAHNADDQVETFFLHLLRGSGETGLSGMKAKNIYPVESDGVGPAKQELNRGIIIRPLLFAWKADILKYLKDNKISFRLDRTNKENVFTRNKVRNLLIPYLEKNFNPNIKKTILRTVENMTPEIKSKNNDGDLRGITSAHLREIIKILKSPKNKRQIFTFQGLKVERIGDRVIMSK